MALYADEQPWTEDTTLPAGVSFVEEEEDIPEAPKARPKRTRAKKTEEKAPQPLPIVQIRLEYTGESEGKFRILDNDTTREHAAMDTIVNDRILVFEGRIKRFKLVADE